MQHLPIPLPLILTHTTVFLKFDYNLVRLLLVHILWKWILVLENKDVVDTVNLEAWHRFRKLGGSLWSSPFNLFFLRFILFGSITLLVHSKKNNTLRKCYWHAFNLYNLTCTSHFSFNDMLLATKMLLHV